MKVHLDLVEESPGAVALRRQQAAAVLGRMADELEKLVSRFELTTARPEHPSKRNGSHLEPNPAPG